MTHTAYIGIGSNLSNPDKNCIEAINKISEHPDINLAAKSPLYQTEPIGHVEQEWFINAAIKIDTELSPTNLLSTLLNLELEMGRIRQEKWGPRLIDLDLLFYDDLILDQEGMTLPHPEIQKRKFVLVPMNEIAENHRHPALKKTISTLLQELADDSVVKKYLD